MLSEQQIRSFRETVWEYYRQSGRSMPWRSDPSPYRVLVSELMLQQTQVSRVVVKFDAFMYTWPDIASLAAAPLSDVLAMWTGLGYNRRAKYLHDCARRIVSDHDGVVPHKLDELVALPGVGINTAGAIRSYAYNLPSVFIETNIRTVFFHHFFSNHDSNISDVLLRPLVEQTCDVENPREWYWALMDYGSYVKKVAGGRLSQSSHHVKQSPLKGSVREVRGHIVRVLAQSCLPEHTLRIVTSADDRFDAALAGLMRDGLVQKTQHGICLTGAPETS